MKTTPNLIIIVLIAIIAFPAITFLAWIRPGQSGILTQGKSPSGQEYCVVQTYKGLTEPYQVSLYIRDTNGVWRWNYLEHEDIAWRSAEVEFTNDTANVFRNGAMFTSIAMPTGTVDVVTPARGYRDGNRPAKDSPSDLLYHHNNYFIEER